MSNHDLNGYYFIIHLYTILKKYGMKEMVIVTFGVGIHERDSLLFFVASYVVLLGMPKYSIFVREDVIQCCVTRLLL